MFSAFDDLLLRSPPQRCHTTKSTHAPPSHYRTVHHARRTVAGAAQDRL